MTDEPSEPGTRTVREPNAPDELPDEPDERFYRCEWVSIKDAAWHFGVRQRAIHKRIAKGQIVGRREGGEWRVRLEHAKWAYEAVEAVPNIPDEPVGEIDAPNEPPNEPVHEPSSSPSRALLDHQAQEKRGGYDLSALHVDATAPSNSETGYEDRG